MSLYQLSQLASSAAGGALLLGLVIVLTNTWDGQNLFIPLAMIAFLAGMAAAIILLLAGLIIKLGKTWRASLLAVALIGLNTASMFVLNEVSGWHYEVTMQPSPPSEN